MKLSVGALAALKLLPKKWISMQPQMGGIVEHQLTSCIEHATPLAPPSSPEIPEFASIQWSIDDDGAGVLVITGTGNVWRSDDFYTAAQPTWEHIGPDWDNYD